LEDPVEAACGGGLFEWLFCSSGVFAHFLDGEPVGFGDVEDLVGGVFG
jgi:hypothetical protein